MGGGRDGGHGGGHGGGWETNWVTLAGGTTTYTGTSGVDALYLGGSGATVTVSAVELLAGGVGTDVVTLAGGGNTLCVAALETLTGGSGTDVVMLAGNGSTLSVSGIETLIGSAGADAVTVTSGTVGFDLGAADGDRVTLAAAGNGTDRILLSDGGPGGPCGGFRGCAFANSTVYDQVANFEAGVDKVVLAGGLRMRLDDDGDGVVDAATAAGGGVDAATTEVVKLSTAAASLTDADFASVRSALGSLTNSGRGADVLVLANDGTNTGLYMVVDTNGDGTIAATEIRLLGLFSGAALGTGDITFG